MGMHSAPRRYRPARTSAEARYRLRRSLSPQRNSTQLLITVLFVILGFTLTAAIAGSGDDSILANARQSDLVSLLDDLAQREARLEAENTRLEDARETLLGGDEYSALIDALQEIRDAGATAIQISDPNLAIRLVANSWFSDSASGVTVSGTALEVPIKISVIGDPAVLKPAIEIPGGLIDTVGSGGGQVVVEESENVEITAIVPLPNS